MFLNTLTSYVTEFDSQESRASTNVPFIQRMWGYPEADIKVTTSRNVAAASREALLMHFEGMDEHCKIHRRLRNDLFCGTV